MTATKPQSMNNTPILTDEQFRALLITISRNMPCSQENDIGAIRRGILAAMNQIYYESKTTAPFNSQALLRRLNAQMTQSQYRGYIY